MPPVTPTANTPLPKPLRTQLENTVKTARDVAENGARAALAQLGFGGLQRGQDLAEQLVIPDQHHINVAVGGVGLFGHRAIDPGGHEFGPQRL